MKLPEFETGTAVAAVVSLALFGAAGVAIYDGRALLGTLLALAGFVGAMYFEYRRVEG